MDGQTFSDHLAEDPLLNMVSETQWKCNSVSQGHARHHQPVKLEIWALDFIHHRIIEHLLD